MNAGTYKSLAALASIAFCIIGPAIAGLSIYMLVKDSIKASFIRRHESDAGMLGRLEYGKETLSLVREGSVGSSDRCDITIKKQGLEQNHFYYELSGGSLFVFPLSGTVYRVSKPDSTDGRTELILKNGEKFKAGNCVFGFRLANPRAEYYSPPNKKARGEERE